VTASGEARGAQRRRESAGRWVDGAPLARLEARIALTALTRAAPALRLAGPPRWKDNLVLRGLSSLPVDLGPDERRPV
jgi:hypothetical protein